MEIHDVKQGSREWHDLRAGMPTGSSASRLVTPTGNAATAYKEYAIELANDLFRGGVSKEKWKGNKHTDHGHKYEPIAADTYEFTYGVKLRQVGFCTDDEITYGMSPDRLAGRSGLVEIKCLDDKGHTSAIVYYHENRKAPPDRIAQCQFQLYVSKKKWVDLYYWHKTLPPLKIRILPIKAYQEMIECQIEAVIEERDKILKLLRSM